MILLRLPGRVVRGIVFLLWFFWELCVANAVVAWEVVTPRHYMRPGIVKVPLHCRNDTEVALLANLISLTPGTLSLEIAEDRTALYVHALHLKSPGQMRAHVQDLERRLLRVLR